MPELVLRTSAAELAAEVAEHFATRMREALRQGAGPVHVVLTGGSMGIASLRQIAALPASAIDWQRIHLWWGDERWLPAGDAERNDEQADAALIRQIAIPAENVHRFPAANAGRSLDEAAADYTAELGRSAAPGADVPDFALVFLGVGPDGHVASLFPGLPGIEVVDQPVIAVRNSPKPPPERLSLTLPVLNSAASVWLMIAGADKAGALNAVFNTDNPSPLPLARVHGSTETLVFADQAAAAELQN